MRLVNGISKEAMDLLRLDDDLHGDNTVYGMKALIPKDKSGELYPSRLPSSVLIKSLIRGSSWLDFDPSEQVLYLEMYAALPVKEQTAEGATKLSQRIANRKV